MKILLQRVKSAEVAVDGEIIARIARGVLLLVGFGRKDHAPDCARAAAKIANLRIFADARGKLAHSLLDVGGAALAVPQFTLHGQTHKGRRPDFTDALRPTPAKAHFRAFLAHLRQLPLAQVEAGRFGAHMRVSLAGDGPFTLMLEW
ncbi:MAG: D-aminoacyl-tRNA deacylase [Gammaproteobacteria bacterium]